MKGITLLKSNLPINSEIHQNLAKEFIPKTDEKVISYSSKKFCLLQCVESSNKNHLIKNGTNIYAALHGYIVNEDELLEYLDKDTSLLTANQMIIDLYIKLGEKFIRLLKGSFSLILMDEKKNIVIAAKDHMSMKPLYYCRDNENLFLSSIQSSIYNNFTKSRQVNLERIDEFLNGVLQKSDHNFFKDILSIPRGSYLIFRDSKIHIKKYFNFDTTKTIYLDSDQAYAEMTKEIFLETLKKYTNKFENFSSKLSGGLDSSAICCGIKKIHPESNFKCINVDYEGLSEIDLKASNEKKFVDDVVSYSKLNLYKHKIKPGDYPLVAFLRDVYSKSDIVLPSFNQGFQISFFKLLNSMNSKVIFDGFDGDSAISFGKEKMIILQRERKLIQLFKERKLFAKYHNLNLSNKSNLKKTILSLFKKPENGSAHELHAGIFDHYGWDYSLEYTQNHANYYGIEEVYPFFDRDLMQYFISLPVNQKLNLGRSRFNFRNAMKNITPDSIRNRYTKGVLSRMWIHEVEKVNINEIKEIYKNTGFERFCDLDKLIHDIESLRMDKSLSNRSGFANEIFQKLSLMIWLEKYE